MEYKEMSNSYNDIEHALFHDLHHFGPDLDNRPPHFRQE